MRAPLAGRQDSCRHEKRGGKEEEKKGGKQERKEEKKKKELYTSLFTSFRLQNSNMPLHDFQEIRKSIQDLCGHQSMEEKKINV